MLRFLNTLFLFLSFSLHAFEVKLPDKMISIMQQPKYQHAFWGLYAKDVVTGQELFDFNSDQMFLPASTTKLFSVAALLHAYGDDYRFKTPVFALGKIENGKLQGNLLLVAQGDLTMGGRQGDTDKIAFTKMDHIIANNVPGAILTKQNPLHGFKELAKQVQSKGIREVNGDIVIDDRLFAVDHRRGMILSPIMVNENLIDFVINPSEIGKKANLTWRPQVPGYTVVNEVVTEAKGKALAIQISSDELGRNIRVTGSIPQDQKDLVRTFSIKDPNHFARAAFIQALRDQGITVNVVNGKNDQLPSQKVLQTLQPIAVWTSPPLSEYAKLILKVSHNLGADLIPLLLAVKNGKTTFEEGMKEFGDFVMNEAKIPSDAFVFIDGAGGDENRLTPKAEVQLLEYMRKLPKEQFQKYYDALPILGVDGSLEDFGKKTAAVGKVRAKPGTGVSFNAAAERFFLTTQALAGYVEGKNGHLIEFMVAVNNGNMRTIEDVFAIFEDVSLIASFIYDQSQN